MHYHVGHNVPGYLPDADVYAYADIDEAIAGLVEELAWHSGNIDTWTDDHDCDDIPCPTYGDDCPYMAARDLESLTTYLTEGNGITEAGGTFLGYAAGQAWWINTCDDDCDTEDEI